MKPFLKKQSKHYKYKKLLYAIFLLLLSSLSITSAQTSSKTKYSTKAVDLQKRAIKYQFNIKDNETQTYSRMLKMLDSATSIEPSYALAYRTKVIPLIKLKKYNEALVVLRKARSIDPTNLKDLIRQGIILESFLNKPNEAKRIYFEAYKQALKYKKGKNNQNPYYDQVVAFNLMFYRGKEEALRYLSNSFKTYTDQKSKEQMKKLENLLRSTPFDAESKISLLNGNN
ncbi:hypothetical protein [Pedobacter aquatilis]|uniref:tetratricopeptide repeat protein n=1 Tax=Pedobacter aquatilis TaxID=351343 RepID=UPI0029308B24|nr:hypothetical protein [Pedobacter aquatilis]